MILSFNFSYFLFRIIIAKTLFRIEKQNKNWVRTQITHSNKRRESEEEATFSTCFYFAIRSMASALQKLLRRYPATRIITSLHASQVPILKPSESQSLPLRRFPSVEVHRHIIHPRPETEHFGASCSTLVFPSFPFGFSLNPISANEDLDRDGDDSRKLWADSVKKKRKKKMNKHKYKKLRKRMRRQS